MKRTVLFKSHVVTGICACENVDLDGVFFYLIACSEEEFKLNCVGVLEQRVLAVFYHTETGTIQQ